jgi:hypothetical protein
MGPVQREASASVMMAELELSHDGVENR